MTATEQARRTPEKSDRTPDVLQLVVAAVGGLLPGVFYLALPDNLSLGPRWLLLVIEVVLLAPPLAWRLISERPMPYGLARGFALALLAVVTAGLIGSIVLLVSDLPHASRGAQMLRTAVVLWGIDILVFALWYWEVDGGGPLRRHARPPGATDFQFPQQDQPPQADRGERWRPGFIDYLFLAFCSATALSPADTMPLTHRAKLLMMAEAIISLLILVLLVARSVNIL
ncbi:MAG TPA: hypothetical protein VIC85_18850 [Ktedonobacterales bacterium]|jgi:uncharacterized membrane protein